MKLCLDDLIVFRSLITTLIDHNLLETVVVFRPDMSGYRSSVSRANGWPPDPNAFFCLCLVVGFFLEGFIRQKGLEKQLSARFQMRVAAPKGLYCIVTVAEQLKRTCRNEYGVIAARQVQPLHGLAVEN